MTEIVTIFKNIKETDAPFFKDIQYILNRIKDGANKKLINDIRKLKDKQQRNELKKKLPAICFSGKFNKRNSRSIEQHSGFICLDFDGYEKKKDLRLDKEKFCKDKYVYACFISPSGNGLKVIIKIPKEPENHVSYFKALEAHFESPYFDKNCKDISRVCYESYDPLIYINNKSDIWDIIADIEYREVIIGEDKPTISIADENKTVDILMDWWKKKYPMIEGQRNQNCYILAMAFNDYGVSKSLAQYVLYQYETQDFTKKEINKTIDSAYNNISNFGTKCFEDDEAVSMVREMVRKGYSRKEVRAEFNKKNIDSSTIDAVIDQIEEDNKSTTFWRFNKDGKIHIVHIAFKLFFRGTWVL